MLRKTLVAAATTLALAGVTATGAAAAYDLTGGDYSSTASNVANFTVGGVYTIECLDQTVTGNTENVPGDPASTLMTPAMGDCTLATFGIPLVASFPDPWKLTVTGGAPGAHEAKVTSARRTLVELTHPLYPLYDCKITIKAPAGGIDAQLWGSGGLLAVESWTEVGYETSGNSCPFSGSGTDGTYMTYGMELPGVDIDTL